MQHSRHLTRLGAALGAFAVASLTALPARATTIVHAGDHVSISVYGHPEFLTQGAVDSNGNVTIPLAGSVHVAGLTTTEASRHVQTAFAEYIKKPSVDLTVTQQISTILLVGGPGGVLPYAAGETLVSALTIDQTQSVTGAPVGGGGTTPIGPGVDLHHVALTRDEKDIGTFDVAALAASGNSGPHLEPGDTIHLTDKPIAVVVRGAVKNPGTAHIDPGETVDDAVAQLGGATENASTEFTLQRGGASSEISAGEGIAQQAAVSGDVVDIPHAVHVSVVGMVGTPGEVTLKRSPTLLGALYYAGGPTKWANLKDVQIVHKSTTTTYNVASLTHGDLKDNPLVTDGDVVFVPEGHKIDIGAILSLASIGRFIGIR